MSNFASLRGPLATNRVFVAVGRPGLVVGERLAALLAGRGFASSGRCSRSAFDAAWFVAWMDRVREAIERYREWKSPAGKARVLAQIAAARERFEQLR